MDILKEAWILANEEQNATFMMDVHTRMQEVSQVVQENMRQAQIKQKIWYEQKACEVNYQPGDQVLLLLPDSTHKFQ